MAHLMKMFQEITHYHNELSRGNEQEILLILDYFERLRQKFHTFQNENFGLQNILRTYDGDRDKSRQDVKELKCQLIEARSQIAALVQTKQSLEDDKLVLEDQIDSVRDLLKDLDYLPEHSRKKLEFLKEKPFSRNHIHPSSQSIVSECEIDYDKTDDSIENETSLLRGGKKWVRNSSIGGNPRKRSRSAPRVRPSAPPIEEEVEPTPKKRSKDDLEIKGEIGKGGASTIVATATFTIPIHGGGTTNAHATAEIKRASLNKSFSEPHLLSPQQTNQFGGRPYLTTSTTNISPLNSYSSSGNLINRRHTFLTKTILKPEYCDACNKRIAFSKSILRCQECKVQCHPECREVAPLPCIPRGTPTSKNHKGKLADFVPPNPPMIPHILVHCVNEIERRGVDTIGLYRVSGTESKVNELLERFLWGKGVPNLRLVEDINVLTSCVKKFLQHLKEPLIPATSWQEFVRASESTNGEVDSNALHQAIADLPLPNKDTLAFLILHLQRVADAKESNSMTASNLAKVFGPTVVGYSTETFNIQQGIAESPKQESVILSLMSLPPEYWTHLVNNSETGPLLLLNSMTPDMRMANYKQLRFDSATKLYPTLPPPSPMGGTDGQTMTLLGPSTPGLFGNTPKSATFKTRSNKRFFQPPWK